MTEETKPKRVVSEEARKKMRLAKLRNPVKFWLGKKRPPMSQETKDKLSQALKGRKLSPEHIRHAVEARIRKRQERLIALQGQVNNNIINNNQ